MDFKTLLPQEKIDEVGLFIELLHMFGIKGVNTDEFTVERHSGNGFGYDTLKAKDGQPILDWMVDGPFDRKIGKLLAPLKPISTYNYCDFSEIDECKMQLFEIGEKLDVSFTDGLYTLYKQTQLFEYIVTTEMLFKFHDQFKKFSSGKKRAVKKAAYDLMIINNMYYEQRVKKCPWFSGDNANNYKEDLFRTILLHKKDLKPFNLILWFYVDLIKGMAKEMFKDKESK